MSAYRLTDELEVEDDGPVRIVRLNRPEQLNATNHGLHQGLAELFPQIDADDDARAVVLTGNGRAFSAGGDFTLPRRARHVTRRCRKETLAHGRQIVTGMVACRVPIVAAVNGPGRGPGLQPGGAVRHRLHGARARTWPTRTCIIGLVAADGGPVTWPLLISLQLAKEYALTGDRIPAERAAADRPGEPRLPGRRGARPGAWPAPTGSPRLPRRAVEDTKRILNLHLERAVVATSTSPWPPRTAPSRHPSYAPTWTGSSPPGPATSRTPVRGGSGRLRSTGRSRRNPVLPGVPRRREPGMRSSRLRNSSFPTLHYTRGR